MEYNPREYLWYDINKRLKQKMTSLSASKPTKEVFMTLPQKCSHADCDSIGYYDKRYKSHYLTHGMCRRHYRNSTREHRNKLQRERRNTNTKHCEAENCNSLAELSSSYCGKHIKRLQKNGNLGYEKGRWHMLTGTSEHRAWVNMMYRCYTASSPSYKTYGGRGIKVCDRWRNSFLNFLEDMGHKPSPEHSIDRVDNNGDYTPENCRWATKSEQAFNRGTPSNNTSGKKGVFKDKGKWRATIRVNGRTVYLGTYSDKLLAITAREKAELNYGV